jgi:heat shock protein HslJ
MNRSRTPFAAVLGAVALLAPTDAGAGTADTPPPPLAGTAWVLAGLPGRTLPAEGTVSLQFEKQRVAVQDGCNRYKAPYKADGGTIEVILEEPLSTMDCAPERTEIAHLFLTALEGARSYKLDGGQLKLLATNGDVLATLAPQGAKRSLSAACEEI